MYSMPYFSPRHMKFKKRISNLYSEKFMEDIYLRLSITDNYKKQQFREYAVDCAVNYLDAHENNKDRLPVFKQRKILNKYEISLMKAKSMFNNLESCNSANATFHDTLRKKIQNSENKDIKKMFSPYIQVNCGEHEFWFRSEPLFNQFLDTLIEATKEATKNIKDDYKADLTSKFLLEYVILMRQKWSFFTDVTFGLGDWYKTNELNDNEKSMYKSVCVDVLCSLFSPVDKKISRSEIEGSVRKSLQHQ